jgi:hypothetical protein
MGDRSLHRREPHRPLAQNAFATLPDLERKNGWTHLPERQPCFLETLAGGRGSSRTGPIDPRDRTQGQHDRPRVMVETPLGLLTHEPIHQISRSSNCQGRQGRGRMGSSGREGSDGTGRGHRSQSAAPGLGRLDPFGCIGDRYVLNSADPQTPGKWTLIPNCATWSQSLNAGG